jgi:3-deoxy-D-manno-octulosonic-acid transferase
MMRLYRYLTYLLGPLLLLYLSYRRRIGKEPDLRRGERLGKAELPRPEGPLLWIHAASVGEAASVLPLITELCERYPSLHILLTTVTLSSAELMERKLPERAMHQYAPIDHPRAVRRFLKHWKPDLALWVESEFWPNMIRQTFRRNIRMVLINARLSQRSYDRWMRFRKTLAELLHCFSIIFPQSDKDAARFEKFGAGRLEMVGNLKYDADPLPADSKAMGTMITMLGGRRLWLAASTHPGEEPQIAQAHSVLKELYPDLLTIIVPRHAARGAAIADELQSTRLSVALRSRKEEISDSTDIYIADTMGELGMFYRMAGIVFMGGTLVPHGGQNPLEAIRLDCAVIYGPHHENFSAICQELEQAGAALQVANITALEEAVDHLFKDQESQELMAKKGLELLATKEGVVQRIIAALADELQKIAGPAQQDGADENNEDAATETPIPAEEKESAQESRP